MRRSPYATARPTQQSRAKRSISSAVTYVGNSKKEKQCFRGRRGRVSKCGFCQRLSRRQKTPQKQAAVSESRRQVPSLKRQAEEPLTRAPVNSCIRVHRSRRPENLKDPFPPRFLQKRRSSDPRYGSEVSLLALLHLCFQHFYSLPRLSLSPCIELKISSS